MKRTRLGMTGLEVSRIAFGTWELGGEWGAFDERDAIAAIRRAFELRVTSASPTSTFRKLWTSRGRGLSRPTSRRTTSSGARARATFSPIAASTTSACSSTARSGTACSRARSTSRRPSPRTTGAARARLRGETFHRELGIVRELRRFAAQRGWSVGQLAIAWTLANPAVHAAIVGSRRPDHIEENLAAADLELGADDLAVIDRIVAGAVPVGGPSPEMM